MNFGSQRTITNHNKESNKVWKFFVVKEMICDDFIEINSMCNKVYFHSQKNQEGSQIKSDIKVVEFEKRSEIYFYKSSYRVLEYKNRTIGTRRSAGVKSINSIISHVTITQIELFSSFKTFSCFTNSKIRNSI